MARARATTVEKNSNDFLIYNTRFFNQPLNSWNVSNVETSDVETARGAEKTSGEEQRSDDVARLIDGARARRAPRIDSRF